jgi:hypothetical protein
MDLGYSSARCKSGLAAAQALAAGSQPGEKRYWIGRERFWTEQLALAMKREREAGEAVREL